MTGLFDILAGMGASFRFSLLTVALLLGGCVGAHGTTPAIGLALTFDDLPAHGILPLGQTRLSVAQAVLGTLHDARAPAIGFVNGSFGADDPDAAAVLVAWRAAGLPLGNHGFSHINVEDVPVERFVADLDRNEPFVAGQPRRFRFPYLSEGRDPARRDAIRAALAERGYRIAAVTLSFDDYAYNAPFARCVAAGNTAEIAAMETRYLAAARRCGPGGGDRSRERRA